MERIGKIRKYMEENNLDGVFYTSPENVFYMSGFSGYGDGTLIITQKDLLILTDFRYNQQVIEECPDYCHIDQNSENMVVTAELIRKLGLKRVGFENETISYAWFTELSNASPDVTYVGIGGITETFRIVKNEYELTCIEKACEISSLAFAEMYDEVKVGMTEREAAARSRRHSI